jgi:hypothetical protein
MLAIEPIGLDSTDEKLGTVGVFTSYKKKKRFGKKKGAKQKGDGPSERNTHR